MYDAKGPTMRPSWRWGAGLLAAAVASTLATAWADGEDAPPAPATAQVTVGGAELYRSNCQGCHGAAGAGTALAPSIADVFTRRSEAEVRGVLQQGSKLMPSFAHLSDAEVDSILAHVTGRDDAKAEVPSPRAEGVALGQRLFRSNCASCHATGPVKDPPPGPASLLNVTRRWSREQILNVIRNGACIMPSFGHLQEQELAGLYAYLETLVDEDAPLQQGGCGAGGPCEKVKRAMATPPGARTPGAGAGCRGHAGGGCGGRAPRMPMAGCGGCQGAR
ncbi:MAG: c-type cytochrome [Planctomycetes bacterium]|nr:c-type cytochrome [Planctomycetota bacterium]